jgi:hypothetical protein
MVRLLVSLLFAFNVWGSNSFVYEGVLTDNSDQPVANKLINIKIEIIGDNACSMWEKETPVTTNANGSFQITLSDDTNELKEAFSNEPVAATCGGATGPYTPAPGDERALKVTIVRVDNDGDGDLGDETDSNVVLTPNQIVSAVPYAISAQTSEQALLSDRVTEININAANMNFTGADLSTVDFTGVDISGALGGGEPTEISGKATGDIASATTKVESADSSNVAGELVVRDGSGDFSAGTISADLVGDVTGNVSGTAGSANALRGTNVSSVAPNSNEFLMFDGTDWVPTVLPSQTSLSTLAVDGDTLHVSEANDRVGIGNSTPQVKLDVAGALKVGANAMTCATAIEGAIRYNSSSKVIEYCNGTAWKQFSPGISASLSLSAPSVGLTQSGPVTYGVTYGSGTDENTITLATGDIILGGSATDDCTVDSVTGTGLTRTVSVSGCTGTGTVDVSVVGDTAKSTTGNSSEPVGPSTSFQVDNTGPGAVGTVTLGSVPSSLSVTPTITYGTATDTGGGTVASYEVQIKKASDDSVIEAWTTHSSGDQVSTTMATTTDYYAEVRAVDSVGNPGTASQSADWTSPDCIPGTQTWTASGTHDFTFPSGCGSFSIEVIGGGNSTGKGGHVTFDYSPGSSDDFRIAVNLGAGNSGGGASAVKHGSTLLAVSGGGGGRGGNGGGGNNPGTRLGSCPADGYPGNNNSGGSAGYYDTGHYGGAGGSNGGNGSNGNQGQPGGTGYPEFLISGGGGGHTGGGASGGGGGYGGGAGGSLDDGNCWGSGAGGGGFVDTGSVTNIVVPSPTNTAGGSVTITWGI